MSCLNLLVDLVKLNLLQKIQNLLNVLKREPLQGYPNKLVQLVEGEDHVSYNMSPTPLVRPSPVSMTTGSQHSVDSDVERDPIESDLPLLSTMFHKTSDDDYVSDLIAMNK